MSDQPGPAAPSTTPSAGPLASARRAEAFVAPIGPPDRSDTDCGPQSVAPHPPLREGGRRPLKRFSSALAREACRRAARGQTHAEICADPAMPCVMTLHRWVKRSPRFARAFGAARALGEAEREGRRARGYCPQLANEITARVSQGEFLCDVADDPAMPSLRTIYRWRDAEPVFAEALGVARAAMAERFTDLGWTLAMAATPREAHLTRVRLNYLRWMCATWSPATHGKLKALDPPAAPEGLRVAVRNFQVEVCPDTGRVRGVAYHLDPESGELVREMVGEWKEPPWPLRRDIDYRATKEKRLALGLPTDTRADTWEDPVYLGAAGDEAG